jgi:hypothetical protein
MRRFPILLAVVGCFLSTAAVRQLPMVWFSNQFPPDVTVDEGNSGTRVARFEITHEQLTRPTTVTYTVAPDQNHPNFPTAVGGTTCGPAVDFIAVTNRAFTIPVGAPNPTYIDVTICGDTEAEPTEVFRISFDRGSPYAADRNVECLERCINRGYIRNDDGTPPPPPKQCTMNGKPFPCPPPKPPTPRCRMVNGQLICP